MVYDLALFLTEYTGKEAKVRTTLRMIFGSPKGVSCGILVASPVCSHPATYIYRPSPGSRALLLFPQFTVCEPVSIYSRFRVLTEYFPSGIHTPSPYSIISTLSEARQEAINSEYA